MSDTNVGLGMVPCRPKCRCNDCTIERLTRANARLVAAGDAMELVLERHGYGAGVRESWRAAKEQQT